MAVASIQSSPLPSSAASTAGLDRRAQATLRALGRPLDPHDPGVIRQTAAQMVSEAVFVPVLSEMREFPFGAEFGNGGRGEATFSAQLDQRVADIVATSQDGGLVAQLARRLERPQSAATNAEPASPASSWRTQLQARSPSEVSAG